MEAKYWVVPDRDATDQGARRKLDELRKRLSPRPGGKPPVALQVVAFGKEFLVVEGSAQSSAAATLRAISLKREYGLPVELQEVPKPYR